MYVYIIYLLSVNRNERIKDIHKQLYIYIYIYIYNFIAEMQLHPISGHIDYNYYI